MPEAPTAPESPPAAKPAKLLSNRRLLWLGIVLSLALIFGVMLWRGISIEPQWVVLALLLVAVALGRGRAFLTDWLPFLVLFFGYEIMRGFASKTGFAPHDVSGLERALFVFFSPLRFAASTLARRAAIRSPTGLSPAVSVACDGVAAGLLRRRSSSSSR